MSLYFREGLQDDFRALEGDEPRFPLGNTIREGEREVPRGGDKVSTALARHSQAGCRDVEGDDCAVPWRKVDPLVVQELLYKIGRRLLQEGSVVGFHEEEDHLIASAIASIGNIDRVLKETPCGEREDRVRRREYIPGAV